MGLISLDWYYESPIDFEHKQYVLFSYLQKVDESFLKKTLSPHLLHMERMVFELMKFRVEYYKTILEFDKNRYIYFNDNPKLENEKNDMIDEIKEIVDFSIPQIESRINFGYKILEKNKQVLF